MKSFPTAHEAAFILGELALELWDQAGGDEEFELAPDRLNGERHDIDADAGLQMRHRLWKHSLKVLD